MTSRSRDQIAAVAFTVALLAGVVALAVTQSSGEAPPFTHHCEDAPYVYEEANCDG